MPKRVVIWTAVSSKKQAREVSLGEQERLARQWCDQHDGEVVAVLSVPGHSRREADILSLFEDFARKGIRAYHDLRNFWKERNFDILVAYDDSRFGRSSTLPSFVMENTILSGAKIEYLQGGTVEKGDGYRYRIAYGSANAATEVDKVAERGKGAKDAKAAFGKLFNSRAPYSHRYVRNELGRLVDKVIDEAHQQVIRDAAQLVIERVGWDHIEEELYARYGHTRNGKRLPRQFFYHLFHNPVFYGHDVRRWRGGSLNGQKTGLWVFDETQPAPDGVLIYYNVHSPALTGGLMAELKSELRRRRLDGSSTRGHRTKMFSGLLRCGYCGHTMVFEGSDGKGYVCRSVYKARRPPKCEQTRYIHTNVIKAYLDPLLRLMLDENNASYFFAKAPDIDQRLAALKAEYSAQEVRSARLVDQRADADDLHQKIYIDKLNESAAILRRLREGIATLEAQAGRFDAETSRYAFEDLKALASVEAFWQLAPAEISHILHCLMGRRRLVVKDRQIVGLTEV